MPRLGAADRVQRPEGMQAAGLRLFGVQSLDQMPEGLLALPRQRALSRLSRTERAGWSSARDLVVECDSAGPLGRADAIVSGICQPVEPAGCGSRGVPGVVRPVHKPEAGSVRRHGKGQRMEVGDKPLRDHGGLPRDGESSAGPADLETDDRLPAPVANEEAATVATGQAVLVIANALSPWFAGLAAHEGKARNGAVRNW